VLSYVLRYVTRISEDQLTLKRKSRTHMSVHTIVITELMFWGIVFVMKYGGVKGV
jgi:hypothetical protein